MCGYVGMFIFRFAEVVSDLWTLWENAVKIKMITSFRLSLSFCSNEFLC